MYDIHGPTILQGKVFKKINEKKDVSDDGTKQRRDGLRGKQK